MDTIQVTIDGTQFKGNKGETIYELCSRNGFEIPVLCHDPRLKPYTSCFVCVVEIEGMKNLQPSCSTAIAEGMKIKTDSNRVRQSRKAALDLLLSNHYADCSAPCKQTCPAGVDVQGYISLIDKGMYSEAVGLIKQVNPLPAICGRVCVRPCEVACRRNLLGEGNAVGIDYLKRFAADQDLQSENHFKPQVESSTGKKVAIIGAGPGGLSTAYFLQQKGHQCDIYEASPKPGGMLRYGIPEYRLPNDLLDSEVECITELGTNIMYNQKLGGNLSYSFIKENYNATVLTIGSQAGTNVGCEGDDAGNVFSGIDFLRNMEMTGKKMDLSGRTVAVVGGGNTAMDCCRTSMRCGAEKTYVIYRRTEKEMPANPIEIHESKLEGIEYLFLTNPKKINKDENGNVKSVTCLKMELGEPDKSGRRRPIPIDGSDFDIEVDYIFAAIGQKTKVGFIDEINRFSGDSLLTLNRWGDIDADRHTLQTRVPDIFAAGDGVTGPATLIEAIAQAGIAAQSCHQYLTGQEVKPQKKEFLSQKDNFKEQIQEEYEDRYVHQLRHEMPVLAPLARKNFDEVELGYESAEIAIDESQRCLECGCSEYFTCDLKKFATEYDVEQTKFSGEYNEYTIDFSHPYIEIDNNKCILCSRCIRICHEVVGADALGLVHRGYETYVAPSMGKSLKDTNCETCGLCISTCPTGAITENTRFKPGPVKTESFSTISPFSAVGEKVRIHHKNGFVMKVEGEKGLINIDGNIGRKDKFGYSFYNSPERITKPLIKKGDSFVSVPFKEALTLIHEKISANTGNKNAFFAGARLTNQEQYLIQKYARTVAKSAAISSFHYLNSKNTFFKNATFCCEINEISEAENIVLLYDDWVDNAQYIMYLVNANRIANNAKVLLLNEKAESEISHKVDNIEVVSSSYHFFRAINYWLLSENKQNGLFIEHHCRNFESFKSEVLNEDFDQLVKNSGCSKQTIIDFATQYNTIHNSLLIFSETSCNEQTNAEIQNLALITGKAGKKAAGIIPVKGNNNSQGLFNNGCTPMNYPGSKLLGQHEIKDTLEKLWHTKDIPDLMQSSIYSELTKGNLNNVFIFGEDPVAFENGSGTKNAILKADFVMVQDAFLTETAQLADVVLPSSFHVEIGGSYSNLENKVQEFKAEMTSPPDLNTYQQMSALFHLAGMDQSSDINDINDEFFKIVSSTKESAEKKYGFFSGTNNHEDTSFANKCDAIENLFEAEFFNRMK